VFSYTGIGATGILGLKLRNDGLHPPANQGLNRFLAHKAGDFVVDLLDINPKWQAVCAFEDLFEGRDRATGKLNWTDTRADLVFGSNSQLRALAEG
jgi:catalase (peroxidase I)